MLEGSQGLTTADKKKQGPSCRSLKQPVTVLVVFIIVCDTLISLPNNNHVR